VKQFNRSNRSGLLGSLRQLLGLDLPVPRRA
jgi:hypothetical protein